MTDETMAIVIVAIYQAMGALKACTNSEEGDRLGEVIFSLEEALRVIHAEKSKLKVVK